MTQEDIIRMAREADIDWHRHWNDDESNRLEAFAALVAAAEREACLDAMMQSVSKGIDTAIALEREACAKLCEVGQMNSWGCAKEIRARGQA